MLKLFQATLRHSNVASLVGVSTSDGPYCSVLEHSLQGDLYNYLRQLSRVTMPQAMSQAAASNIGSTSSTSTTSSGTSINAQLSSGNAGSISYTKILEMASQIAAGMKYLESRNIVHKDLAAR